MEKSSKRGESSIIAWTWCLELIFVYQLITLSFRKYSRLTVPKLRQWISSFSINLYRSVIIYFKQTHYIDLGQCSHFYISVQDVFRDESLDHQRKSVLKRHNIDLFRFLRDCMLLDLAPKFINL